MDEEWGDFNMQPMDAAGAAPSISPQMDTPQEPAFPTGSAFHEFNMQPLTQAIGQPLSPLHGGQVGQDPVLDPSIAPRVPDGASRPFAPGEYVRNPDGSWSSEMSMTVEHPDLNGGKATVIPSLWLKNGKPYVAKSEDEAVDLARKSGLNFRSFGSVDEAEKFSIDRESSWQTINKPEDARKIAPLWTNKGGALSAPPNFNKDAFNSRFTGPLAGKADFVEQKAQQYGVPPSLASAIIAQETGWGKAIQGNNVGGMMRGGGSEKMQFGSLDEGIDKAVANIAKQYERSGRSLEGLRDIYAPLGAKNDPKGLNKDWLPGVSKIMGLLQ